MSEIKESITAIESYIERTSRQYIGSSTLFSDKVFGNMVSVTNDIFCVDWNDDGLSFMIMAEDNNSTQFNT